MEESATDDARYDLNLDQSRAPGAFRGKENLWKEDLKRIYLLIQRHIAALAGSQKSHNRRDSDPKQLFHLSIAIFGPSGSGKSSLLRTLEDDANRKQDSIKHEARLDGKIHSLPVIDPTTWSSSDQFLYAFLATALEEEVKRQEHKEDGFPQGLSPVQLAFQEVNEYLRVVDESELSEEYDPLGLSLQKLERHTSGLRLREALGKFTRALAKEFDSEVILLPVDDLDLAPDHLVKSLKDYQSFLAHAPLVPIFTFTDRMSEELIEAHYESSIVGTERRKKSKKIDEDLTLSEKLAVQFLARCFPVRNRIRLGPAPGRVQRAFFSFQPHRVMDQEPEKERFRILELLTIASFLLFGHPDNKDSHKVRAALRPSTLRRQLQVVDAMADCRLSALRIPQLAEMALPDIKPEELEKIARFSKEVSFEFEDDLDWNTWLDEPGRRRQLGKQWGLPANELLPKSGSPPYLVLAYRLWDLRIGATWATIFNSAVWSLLNVHRDTLRELGLFLEDLYSWNPRELRSVVLGKILDQDRAKRRTVVDRWFNQNDYRRSQVLSLLAANIFRPWMEGEEPYGDDEKAIHKQRDLESSNTDPSVHPLDQQWQNDSTIHKMSQTRVRLSFPAFQGLLWFIDVTMGFYLPQIMARDWPSTDVLRDRMSDNGWDLRHAPVGAIRAAEAKREIGSFGMLILGPIGYSKSLTEVEKNDKDTPADNDDLWRQHLLLRIWSCYGYDRSKFWSAFSLWRGLGFIGQVLELGLKNDKSIRAISERRLKPMEMKSAMDDLREELCRLIRSHCLTGLIPGSLLGSRESDDELLKVSFRRWEPHEKWHDVAIKKLAMEIIGWLKLCREDRIFPLPAADIQIGWRDCFIRRIHGEYILGGLWPRLNSTYLEKQKGNISCRKKTREEDGPWTAALAAAVWSDTLLEYWRGCPPILFQLLTCPVFFKSRERFGQNEDAPEAEFLYNDGMKFKKEKSPWLARLEGHSEFWDKVAEIWQLNEPNEYGFAATLVSDILCIERAHPDMFDTNECHE